MLVKNRVLCLTLILLACLGVGCASQHFEEGHVQVIGGKVWYRMVGNGPGTPVIVVHGGPGVPHDYLESLEELAKDRPVIFYDQLGCGRSDRPSAEQLWIPRRFAREIDAIRTELNINECYIFADSWGGVIASEYMLSLPKGVRGVIFSSPVFSGERYVADAEHLLDKMPAKVRTTIRKHEADGSTGSPEYKKACKKFFKKYVCRKWWMPDDLKRALQGVGIEVYASMHGRNMIDINGSLRDYDRTGDFWQINVPVLITCGRYDVTTPETAAFYQSKMNKAQLAVFQDSSHMPIFEEHDSFIEVIRDFMRDRDKR